MSAWIRSSRKAANFTPGYFDLRPHLKGNGQSNELVVRVGSAPSAVAKGYHWGFDREKLRYTCDNFIDIDSLAFEPHFQEYVGDSFSPVGVMIDYWQIEHAADVGSVNVPVVVTSDLGEPWKGKLVLKLLRGDQVLQQEERPLSLDSLGQQSVKLMINFPKQKGRYRLVAELLGFGDKPVRSLRDIEVL